ncbi:sodium:proton antiporter [Ancylomarina salipaludis]|uniref:Sodium:proton antiporter n=1 Tax=Ancylomarina salipaludis TaxID=2501299 RepID=A0A4Q1JNT7_9BACT|nr:sodium:proton antiporter [Ancylomarina salipaludis]RXQ95826.1 sodium:proton antiporter [Ancylomarina salipaludis]
MFDSFVIVLAFSALFSLINTKYLKLSPTIGMMILALIMSVFILLVKEFAPSVYQFIPTFERDIHFREFLLEIILSFLLFAGAMHINIKDLQKQRKAVFVFAIFGTLISTFLVGTLTFYAAHLFSLNIPYVYSLLFGALISPTDPIAVLSILKNYSVRKDLQMNIEGESLFNDGVGMVLFVVILQVINKGYMNVQVDEVIFLFLREAVGGIAFGLLIGFLGFQILKRTENNAKTHVMLSIVMASGGYSLAENIHVSPALAMVAAGLYLGNMIHSKDYSKKNMLQLVTFWDVLDEILNGVLFVMLGFFITLINPSVVHIPFAIITILVVLIARYISVLVPFQLIKHSNKKVNRKTILILTWGGLRGALGIALALAVPPEHFGDLFVFLMYSVALFSIIIQGLTIGKLVKKLNLVNLKDVK